MTRARDVADVQDNLGGAIAPVVSGKNFAINGNFDIWQRGTSFPTQGVYTADRWYNTQSANITGSRQTSGAPDGSQYFFRQTATSTGGYYTMAQVVETANASQLWGKTVTFSVKLKRNSTFDAGTFIQIAKNPAVDASPGTVWTEIAITNITAVSISTTAWTTFSVTATIPNDGTANSIRVIFAYGTNPANGSVIDCAQFQLEVGSVATPFSRAGGSIGGELALCQRYYYRTSGTAAYYAMAQGVSASTTAANALFQWPVTLRAASTDITYGNLYFEQYNGTAGLNPTITAANASNNVARLSLTGMTGLTAGQVGYLFSNNSSTSYLAVNAEL